MNIILLGTIHRLKNALLTTGNKLITCGPGKDCDIHIPDGMVISLNYILKRLPATFNPELLLYIDNNRPLFLTGLENSSILTAWYAIDTHLQNSWHGDCAKLFDFVFVAQKDFVNLLKNGKVDFHVKWLPLFCKTGKDKKLLVPKEHAVSFVGNINKERNPRRAKLISALRKRIPIYCTKGTYVDVFNKSKIVLNQSVKNDVNFRTFEALGCGSFLLTDSVSNGLSELFADKKHLVLYESNNVEQIVNFVNYYLEHDQERDNIALQGMQESSKKHTDICRAETIINTIAAVDPVQMIIKRKATLFLRKQYAAKMYVTLLFQYDYPDAVKSFFYTQGVRLISEAFEYHLSKQNIPEVLQDAVIYGDILIANGLYDDAVNILNTAVSLTPEKKSSEIGKLISEIRGRINLAKNFQ